MFTLDQMAERPIFKQENQNIYSIEQSLQITQINTEISDESDKLMYADE